MRLADCTERVLVMRPFVLGQIRGEPGAVIDVPVAALRSLERSGTVKLLDADAPADHPAAPVRT